MLPALFPLSLSSGMHASTWRVGHEVGKMDL